MRAKAAYIYVRGEFWHEANCLQQAVDEVKKNINLRLTKLDFWVKMHAVLAMILMFMFTAELEPTFVVNKLVSSKV